MMVGYLVRHESVVLMSVTDFDGNGLRGRMDF